MARDLTRAVHEARRQLPLILTVCAIAFTAAAPCFGQSVLVNTANGGAATAVLVAKAIAVILIIFCAVITTIGAAQGHAAQALMGFGGLVFGIVLMLLAPSVVTMITNWANSGTA